MKYIKLKKIGDRKINCQLINFADHNSSVLFDLDISSKDLTILSLFDFTNTDEITVDTDYGTEVTFFNNPGVNEAVRVLRDSILDMYHNLYESMNA